MKINHACKKGFALLELLVAMVILFGTVALAASVVGTVSKSAQTSYRAIHLARFKPMLASQIEYMAKNEAQQFRQESHQGRIWDINYQWTAEPTVASRGPRYFDDADGRYVDSPYQFTLWQVTLLMTFDGLQDESTFEVLTRHYEG